MPDIDSPNEDVPNIDVGFGLINEDPRDADYVHLSATETQGGTLWIKKKEVVKNGNVETISWEDDEPDHELQKKLFETNGCVSFSYDNMFEYLANYEIKRDEDFKNYLDRLKLLTNGKANVSDRRTVKGSGTSPYEGNTVRAVDDYGRGYLFCPEDLWPFPDVITLQEYFSSMTAEVADYGKKVEPFLTIETKYLLTAPWNFDNAYSSPEQIWDGLQYSPVWASVDGRYEFDDGLVGGIKLKESLDQQGGVKLRNYSHRILIRGAEKVDGVITKFIVHDQYQKQIVPFSGVYPFGRCKIMNLIKKKVMKLYRKQGQRAIGLVDLSTQSMILFGDGTVPGGQLFKDFGLTYLMAEVVEEWPFPPKHLLNTSNLVGAELDDNEV